MPHVVQSRDRPRVMIGGPHRLTAEGAITPKRLEGVRVAVGVGRGVGRAMGSPFLCATPHGSKNARPKFSSVCYPRKKEPELQPVNHAVLAVLNPEHVEVEIWRSDELEVRRGLSSELDEMWSFVQAKAHPRWLWHAIDHHTGKVLAYVFGRRKDAVFLRLQELLEPFGITKYYTDGWGAYERHLDAKKHHVGKENTQKIESKHINLRTRSKRLVRRTLCFSKTEQMHDLVIGLFMNRYEFGRAL